MQLIFWKGQMIHKPLCGGIRIDLVVYEFADAGPPDLDAELHMGLPLAGRTLKVRLRDLSKSP